MFTNISLLLLILLQIVAIESNFCSFKSMTSSQIKMKARLSPDKQEVHTVLGTSLRLGEKVCSELLLENDNGTVMNATKQTNQADQFNRRFLTIELTEVWQVFDIKSDYNFSLPTIDIDCLCDCTGWPHFCSRKFEADSDCKSDKKNLPNVSCFKQHSHGHSSEGCFFGIFKKPTDVCCIAAMYQEKDSVVYRALYIATPTTRYKYTIELVDNSGNVLDSYSRDSTTSINGNFNIKPQNKEDKLKVTSIQNNFRLEVNGLATTNLLPSMWMYYDPITEKIMVNNARGVNLVDETDLHKLGWYKVGNQRNPRVNAIRARSALHIKVKNCGSIGDDQIEEDWDFDAVGWRKKGKVGQLNKHERGEWIKDFYNSTIADVLYAKSGRYIKVIPRSTVAVPITMTLDFSTKLLAYYHRSQFRKFDGSISLDGFSNRIVYLNIEMAFGNLLVVIGNKTSCTMQETEITTNSMKPDKWQAKIPLSACFEGRQLVCLRTLPRGRNEIFQCKMLAFRQVYFEGPRFPNPPGRSRVGALDLDEEGTSISWWKNMWSRIEDFKSKMYSILISAIVLVSIVIALCNWRKIKSCFCKTKKKLKNKTYIIREKEQESFI